MSIDSKVESWTRQLHDDYFNPIVWCEFCEKSFRESDLFETNNDKKINFCSEKCVKEYEEENEE